MDATDCRNPALEHLHSHTAQLVPRRGSCSPFGNYFPNCSRVSASDMASSEAPRPLASFLRFEGISFSAVSAFLAPDEAPTQTYKYNTLTHALTAYQQSVSIRTGVPEADICWFQQWRFPGVEPSLSFSSSSSSPECSLSSAICYLLASLESLFLVVEHEMLQEASNPSTEPPLHPGLDFSAPANSSTLPTPPIWPDPLLLNGVYIPCGVNQMRPLIATLDHAVRSLLSKYRACLPRQQWHAVCMQTMHMTQAIVHALGGSTETSAEGPGHSTDSHDMHGPDACGGQCSASHSSESAVGAVRKTHSEQVSTFAVIAVSVLKRLCRLLHLC